MESVFLFQYKHNSLMILHLFVLIHMLLILNNSHIYFYIYQITDAYHSNQHLYFFFNLFCWNNGFKKKVHSIVTRTLFIYLSLIRYNHIIHI